MTKVCSFCAQPEDEARPLVTTSLVTPAAICPACVRTCAAMFASPRVGKTATPNRPAYDPSLQTKHPRSGA